MTRKFILTLAIAVIIIVLLVPFRTTVVPRWSLRLVDQHGEPIGRTNVSQDCFHYTYFLNWNICEESLDARQVTDGNGYVEFSEKSISVGLLSRGIRGALSYVLLLFHGSVGVRATLYVDSASNLEPSVINMDAGPPANGLIVLKRNE